MVDFNDFKEKFAQYGNDANSRLSFFSSFEISSSAALENMLGDASLLCEHFRILLLVAKDPWSRIRNASIQSVYNVLQKMVEREEEVCRTIYPASLSLQEKDKGKSMTLPSKLYMNRLTEGKQLYAPSSFFEMLLKHFEEATYWYEKDGLIRLLSRISSFWVKDNAILSSITSCIALPSLEASELPIREGASDLLVHISVANPEGVPELKRHFFDSLALLMNETSEKCIHTLEGNLIALSKVFDATRPYPNATKVQYHAKELDILIQLASHSAASIRSYVAEALRPPSEDFFVLASKQILEFSRLSCLEDKWALYETMMMIMNQHLCYYLDHPIISFYRCVAQLKRSGIISLNQVGVSLVIVLLSGINSSLFEVKRISLQVLPNWIQFYVRHVGSIFGVFELYHSLVNKTLLSWTSPVKNDSNPENCKIVRHEFDQYALPRLWWYVVLYLVTRSHPLRDFERRILQLNIKKHLYIPLLQRSPSTAHVVFLIMSTYFPHLCSVSILEEMMRKESWRSILEPYGQQYIHFGIDFVLMMRQKGINVSSLISVWATALEGLMSHQQCILLTMITEAIRIYEGTDDNKNNCGEEEKLQHSHLREGEQEKREREGVQRPFSFAYDYTYKAPAMVDGGEDTALGYTWLKSKYPLQSMLPLFSTFAQNLTSEAKPIEVMRRKTLCQKEFLDESSVESIKKNILKALYPSSGTDGLVLQKIRNLMILLLKMDQGGKWPWSNWILDSIFSRLSALAPNWKDKHPTGKLKSNDDNDSIENDHDDWDASDDEGHCFGEGLLEEKKHALEICQAFLKLCHKAHSEEYSANIDLLMGN